MTSSHLTTGYCEQCGDVRQSATLEGVEYVRRIGLRMPPRSQWAFQPSDGDVTGRRATPKERQAIRRLYRQGRLP